VATGNMTSGFRVPDTINWLAPEIIEVCTFNPHLALSPAVIGF
jgi:hypothetical protein